MPFLDRELPRPRRISVAPEPDCINIEPHYISVLPHSAAQTVGDGGDAEMPVAVAAVVESPGYGYGNGPPLNDWRHGSSVDNY